MTTADLNRGATQIDALRNDNQVPPPLGAVDDCRVPGRASTMRHSHLVDNLRSRFSGAGDDRPK